MTTLERIEEFEKEMLIKISALKKELAGGSDSSILKPHVKEVLKKRRRFIEKNN